LWASPERSEGPRSTPWWLSQSVSSSAKPPFFWAHICTTSPLVPLPFRQPQRVVTGTPFFWSRSCVTSPLVPLPSSQHPRYLGEFVSEFSPFLVAEFGNIAISSHAVTPQSPRPSPSFVHRAYHPAAHASHRQTSSWLDAPISWSRRRICSRMLGFVRFSRHPSAGAAAVSTP